MRLRAAIQPEQLHKVGAGMEISADPLACKAALTAKGDHIHAAEGLLAAGIGQHHFHGGHAAHLQRFQNGHAVIGVAARVEDDAIGPACRRLDLIDEVTLVVGLKKVHLNIHLGTARLDIIQQCIEIDLPLHARLRELGQVEVGTVND